MRHWIWQMYIYITIIYLLSILYKLSLLCCSHCLYGFYNPISAKVSLRLKTINNWNENTTTIYLIITLLQKLVKFKKNIPFYIRRIFKIAMMKYKSRFHFWLELIMIQLKLMLYQKWSLAIILELKLIMKFWLIMYIKNIK